MLKKDFSKLPVSPYYNLVFTPYFLPPFQYPFSVPSLLWSNACCFFPVFLPCTLALLEVVLCSPRSGRPCGSLSSTLRWGVEWNGSLLVSYFLFGLFSSSSSTFLQFQWYLFHNLRCLIYDIALRLYTSLKAHFLLALATISASDSFSFFPFSAPSNVWY